MPILDMRVNNRSVEIAVDAGDMLADVLRDRLGLTGTNVGCGEGECGACTVLVDGVPTLSCIYPAMKARGRDIVTIEGLAAEGELHPVQAAFVEHCATQCGFCTPGFVMSAVALLRQNPTPSREEIREGLSGNLCRCTGYYQIFNAVEDGASRSSREPSTRPRRERRRSQT